VARDEVIVAQFIVYIRTDLLQRCLTKDASERMEVVLKHAALGRLRADFDVADEEVRVARIPERVEGT
jgi:hypothetical protein